MAWTCNSMIPVLVGSIGAASCLANVLQSLSHFMTLCASESLPCYDAFYDDACGTKRMLGAL